MATTNAMTTTNGARDEAIVERVIAVSDLSKLSPGERTAYYVATCRSLGINPLTRPFDYISLSGKLTLYARKECSDQLRASRGVSITRLERSERDGLAVVVAHARDAAGREDEDMGAVAIHGLKGESLANALMKATTKAKRRVTLSICGLGMLDESEIETVQGAQRVRVDHETGEILSPIPEPPATDAPRPNKPDHFVQMQTFISLAVSGADLDAAKETALTKARAGLLNEAQLLELSALSVAKRKTFAPASAPAITPPPDAGDAWEPSEPKPGPVAANDEQAAACDRLVAKVLEAATADALKDLNTRARKLLKGQYLKTFGGHYNARRAELTPKEGAA